MIPKKFLFFALILFLAVLAICHPFGLYFLCDDFAHILKVTNDSFFQTHLLRPVANISLWVDVNIWGMKAEGFHLTNVLLHVISSLLVFFFTKAIIRHFEIPADNSYVPSFAGLLFLCYGFHTEPIFWIVGRGATLSAIFILFSLLFFLKDKWWYLAPSLLCFAVGLFTYEVTWMLPFFVSLMAIYAQVMLGKVSLLKKIGYYWLVFFAYVWYRFFFLKYQLPYGSKNVMDGDAFRLFRNTVALLARIYTPPYQDSIFFVLHFVAVTAILLFLLYKALRKAKETFFFLTMLSVLTLISVLPAMPLGIDTHDTESERFIYMASVFGCIFFVLLLSAAIHKIRYRFIILQVTILINLAYLYHFSKPYRYASEVSHFVIESLNTVPHVKKLTFTNLPSQYRGGLLFRTGFMKDAPGILKASYDSVTVHSFTEIKEPVSFTSIQTGIDTLKEQLFVDFRGDQMILRQ